MADSAVVTFWYTGTTVPSAGAGRVCGAAQPERQPAHPAAHPAQAGRGDLGRDDGLVAGLSQVLRKRLNPNPRLLILR